MLCSSVNELQQNSNASSIQDYIPQILTVLLEILSVSGGGGGRVIHWTEASNTNLTVDGIYETKGI